MERSLLIPILKFFSILLGILAFTEAHYTDDSDYEDLDYYRESTSRHLTHGDNLKKDDIYILNEVDEPEDRSRRFATDGRIMNQRQVMERSFRYTKYRISGHDYDELEYNKDLCPDDRTVWSHCVCQFTCFQPDIIDCFEPCNSGCECREQFVYDEKNSECIKPEKCPPSEDDYLFY